MGHKLVINTNRSYLRTLSFSEEISADYVICFSGNCIIKKNKIIYSNPFSDHELSELLNELDKQDFSYLVECFHGTYRNKYNFNCVVSSEYINFKCFKFKDCYKILIKCNENEVDCVSKIIKNLDLTGSYDAKNNLYRVLPKNTDKWNGLNAITKPKDKIISFGDDITDKKTLENSFVGIKVGDENEDLSNIEFSISKNDVSGVGNFLVNFFNLDVKTNFDNINILDCTLRDGGHVNNSNFGYKFSREVIKKLVKSKIDFIELGFLENCKYDINIMKFSKVLEAERLLDKINPDESIMSLLVQVDKFDIDSLEECKGKIKMIRVSFHNNLISEGIRYCKEVLKKGYLCSCNPINFSSYTNEEIIALIKEINDINLDYFCIVDTFGIMKNNDFRNKLNLIEVFLNKKIKLGLHLHDNLSSSFSAAQILSEAKSKFNNITIDASVCGMGRAPGNLKTELLAYYLNSTGNKRYKMKYIYEIMENYINPLKNKFDWNNNFIYSLSAFEQIHRSYAEYLITNKVKIYDCKKIFTLIPSKNKGRYDENLITEILNNYMESGIYEIE